jgi:transcriptional regulator with XRE-family HTH domain
MKVLDKTYFEQNASELLNNAHLTKAAFAEKIGIKPQNVNKVFETKNVKILSKAANVLNTSLEFLVSGKNSDTELRINGFVEIDGVIYKLSSKEDIENVLSKL